MTSLFHRWQAALPVRISDPHPLPAPLATKLAALNNTGESSARRKPGGCTRMREVAARLAAAMAMAESEPSPIDRMVPLQLADLKQMDRWGVRIRGETLRSYFDLGSLDDVEPHYPVTPEEASALMDAMGALIGAGGGPPQSSRWRWRDAV